MKKTLKDELLYIKNLELNIKAASQILKRKQSRLESLQDECCHDIVIVAKVISIGYSLKAKCLFCGKHFSTPHELREIPNKNNLEACYCEKFQYSSESEIYDFITSQAEIAILKNPDITKKELGEYLEQFLKDF